MAYANKYSLSWGDVEGISWSIYFQEDNWGGGVTALTPGPTPAKLTWNGGDKYQVIVGSSLEIQMVYDSNIDDLHTEESQDILVELYRDSSMKWSGYISPGQYYKQFNEPIHYVTITANDGLGELKNIKYEDGSGDPYFGLATEISIIAACLAKTGINDNIAEFINMYDTNHNTTSSDSPLAQTYVYREKYWDEQTDERSDCYTVLEDILKKYGATIRRATYWFIYRVNMLSMDSGDYRIFTHQGVYSSNGSSTLYEEIGSSTFYIYTDQELRKLMGLGSCEITVDPPRRKNMFKNGSFDDFTWTTGLPDYWSEVYSSGTTLEISEVDGKLRLGSNGTSLPIPTEYIETTFMLHDITSATISFDWTPTFTGTPTHRELYFQLYDGTYYLTNAGWQSGVGYYTFTASLLAPGVTQAGQIDIPAQFATGYDKMFDLRVRIYEFYNENPPASNYVDIDNLRLEVDMSTASTKIYSYENPLTINQSKEETIALGDSWITDLYASETDDDSYFVTTYDTSESLTSEWQITGDPTAGAPIGEVLARQYVEGFRRSIDELSGTIRSQLWQWGIFAIKDNNFVDEYGFTKVFFPTNVTYNARKNECNGTWVEVPPTYTDEEMEWVSCVAPSYTITANQLEVNSYSGPGGVFGTFDSYTAVAGETIRISYNIVNDGGSNTPYLIVDGDVQSPRAFGDNYYTVTFSSAGAKTITIGAAAGYTINMTATVDVYSITGI